MPDGNSTLTHATSWGPEAAGAVYERGRPGYPQAAATLIADRLELGPGSRLADVAAGTGKLTRLLAESSAGQVIAVEPMPGMRAQLRRTVPSAQVVAGTVERLPFSDGSLDAVTVAQAFHWFRVPEAAAELARVLGPGGRLVVVNNRPRATASWQDELWTAVRRSERKAPRPESIRGWRHALADTQVFTFFDRIEIPHEQRFAGLEDLDARFGSISFVLLLGAADRAALMAELHAIVAGVGPLVLPLTTIVEIAGVNAA